MINIANEYKVLETQMLSAIYLSVKNIVPERLYSGYFFSHDEIWIYIDECFDDTHKTTSSEVLHELEYPLPTVMEC